MFERTRISVDEVAGILRKEEGHFVDMKSALISPSKLSRTLSAFANTDGGEVFIGVSEDKVAGRFFWNGLASVEDANGIAAVIDALFPMGTHITSEFLRPNRNVTEYSGYVLHVTVGKTPDIVRSTDGDVYVRRNAQNLPIKDQEGIDRLKRNKGIISFESHPVAASISEITNSEAVIAFMIEIVPTADPETWLKKQRLIIDSKPTVAALLLFSDEPQIALPKRSAIKIYRYRTNELEGSRGNLDGLPITIEGCLYTQVRRAVDETIKIIEQIKVLGPTGFEPVVYPRATLHEIITNAVLHRDYAVADDVHVRIFDNRVEVESPGRLPAHITAENILRERFSRNGTLVRLINKFPDPPNKDVGEGLNTAFAAMKQLQLKDPIIIERENSVLVNIRHQRLASPEQLIMEYLSRSTSITNREAREITGIGSEGAITKIFNRLRETGEIELIPGRRGSRSAWRRKAQIPDSDSRVASAQK